MFDPYFFIGVIKNTQIIFVKRTPIFFLLKPFFVSAFLLRVKKKHTMLMLLRFNTMASFLKMSF
jgi:hypothetical protein